MKKLLLMSICCFALTPALAAVEGDYTGGGVIETQASKSEVGSKIDMIDKDFNLKAVQEAFDDAPNGKNVKVYDYALNKTFAVRLRQNMATTVVLPSWEKIKAFSLADDLFFSVTNFDIEDMQNYLVLQGKMAGVDTNLTVIGASGKIYNFYLRNDSIDSPEMPHFTVYIKDQKPMDMQLSDKTKAVEKLKSEFGTKKHLNPPQVDQFSLEKAKADYLNTLEDKEDINLDFEISGDIEIAPRAVYSRHGWTFFDFRETLPSDRLPVLFKVTDSYDAVVNYRMENGFLIAETISEEGWTLRNGDKVVCVRNK